MYPRPESFTPPNERSFGRKGIYLNAVFVGVVSSAVAGAGAWLLAFGGIGTIEDTIARVQFSGSSPWVTLASPHQDVADAAILTLSEMPPGWVVATDDDGGDDDFDIADINVDRELSEGCKQFVGQVAFSEALTSSVSEKMKGPEKQTVRSAAYVYRGADEAEGSLERQRLALSNCRSDFEAIFNDLVWKGLEQNGAPLNQLQVQTAVEDLGSPNVGESGLMFRLRLGMIGPGGSKEVSMDFMTFRQGRMVGYLSYLSVTGLPPEEEQQLAQIAAAKLQAASASLPEP